MNAELNKKGILYGLQLGGIGILISLITYFISVDTYIGNIRQIGMMITSIVLFVYWGRKERNEHFGGYMEYQDAYWFTTIILFITIYIGEITFIIMHNMINPEMKTIIIEQSMEEGEKFMLMFNFDQSEIDEMVIQTEHKLKNAFKPFSLLANSWQVLLQAMFFALVMALFIKKKRPLFDEFEETSNDELAEREVKEEDKN
ncbi:MAG: DUF4199 domain-containing protein [Reichenbachiella sp.]